MSPSLRALLIPVVPLLAFGQNRSPYCEAPREVWEQVLDATAVDREKGGKIRPYAEFFAERRARVDALWAKYPRDFHVGRAHLAYSKHDVAAEELIAEFKKLSDTRPADIGARHLYAESLVGKRTPEAIRIFDEIVAKDPSFPWPYRMLVNVYRSPVFSDQAKAKANLKAFIERCPDTTAAAQLAANLDSSEDLAKFAERLRNRIAGKLDRESVNAYSSLWRIEFKVTPAPEHARVRMQVTHDLKFIETLDPKRYRNARDLLEQGYKLTDNKAALDKLSADASGAYEKNGALFRALEAWDKANPSPPATAEAEVKETYHRKYAEFLATWEAKLPDLDFVAVQRLQSLAELKETPAADLLTTGEHALKAYRENEPYVFSFFTTPEMVAQAWAKRGLALDRIPALLDEGSAVRRKRDAEENESGRSDLYRSPDDAIRKENAQWARDTMRWETLVTAYTKRGTQAEARAKLTEWQSGLDARRKRAAEIRAKRGKDALVAPGSRDDTRRYEDGIVSGLGFDESRYLSALAELARSGKRNNDALAMYQAALRALAGSSAAPSDLAKSDPAMKAATLWRETGGTNEGWQLWLESAKPAQAADPDRSKWTAITKALPDFTMNDRNGKTWTTATVRGKTTLLNVWATWCGPCRAELPHLQILHDRIKNREDVQVVTLNVDDNTGLVEPYLAENKFTFPVLFGKDFVDALVGPLGIPTTWIADRDGNLRSESVGFGGDGEVWIKATMAELERIRAQAIR